MGAGRPIEDLTKRQFGRLTVIERYHDGPHNMPRWLCRCNCGNENPVVVYGHSLRSRHTQSCGCLLYECYGKRTQPRPTEKLYDLWIDMLNTSIVSSTWYRYKSFKFWALQHGYQDGKGIERKDGRDIFKPGNCYFAAP